MRCGPSSITVGRHPPQVGEAAAAAWRRRGWPPRRADRIEASIPARRLTATAGRYTGSAAGPVSCAPRSREVRRTHQHRGEDRAHDGDDRRDQQDVVQARVERRLRHPSSFGSWTWAAPPKVMKSDTLPPPRAAWPDRCACSMNVCATVCVEDRAPGGDAGGDADLAEGGVDARRHARAARLARRRSPPWPAPG